VRVLGVTLAAPILPYGTSLLTLSILAAFVFYRCTRFLLISKNFIQKSYSNIDIRGI
jgi:hypothetical protein